MQRQAKLLSTSLLVGCVFIATITAAQEPSYDGILRAVPDGRAEAYLKPPFPSNHASNLELLSNHDVLLAWFSGSQEGKSNVAIVLSHLYHGSNKFTTATVVSQRPGFSNQNPVLFHDNTTDRVFLFHSQQQADKGESNSQIWALQSNDSRGNFWSPPQPLFAKPGSFDRNRVVVTLKNTWLLPMYYSVDVDTSTVMEGLHHDLNTADWKEHPIHFSWGLIQPSIVRPKPGGANLVAFFRDEKQEHIYRSDSADDGVTWSRPTKTTLPNNNSGIQATVLYSGRIAMVYNPMNKGRNVLVISLSQDGGNTWPYTRTLETSTNQGDEFSYPSIAQDEVGQIHVSHTYKRETIKYQIIPNEDWIIGKNTQEPWETAQQYSGDFL